MSWKSGHLLIAQLGLSASNVWTLGGGLEMSSQIELCLSISLFDQRAESATSGPL